MSWSGMTCTIESCEQGIELAKGQQLRFPSAGGSIQRLDMNQGLVESAWTIESYDDVHQSAVAVYGGEKYTIRREGTLYTCDPSNLALAGKAGPGLLPLLAGALSGIVTGTVIGTLLGLPAGATGAVAAGAVLVQLAIAAGLRPPRGGGAGTTWTARDHPT